jgi:hypothetical protein
MRKTAATVVRSSDDTGGIRHGSFHGPTSRNATGLPLKAAASTRSGLPLPGHVPIHAARSSDEASHVH